MLRRPSKAPGDVYVRRHLALQEVRGVECAFGDLGGSQLIWLHVLPFLDTPGPARLWRMPSIRRVSGETAKRLVG
jgi:hypothetical protein